MPARSVRIRRAKGACSLPYFAGRIGTLSECAPNASWSIRMKTLTGKRKNVAQEALRQHVFDQLYHPEKLVPEARLELAHPLGRRILNPLRLPFHHSGNLWRGLSPRTAIVNAIPH